MASDVSEPVGVPLSVLAAQADRFKLEMASNRLTAVTPPHAVLAARYEVQRRAEIMGPLYAIESVYDDLVQGRWQP